MTAHEDEKVTRSQGKPNKPRFQIVKLEERIAPRHSPGGGTHSGGGCHYNPQGKLVGNC